MLTLNTEKADEVVCLTLEGRLDAVTADQLSESLMPHIEQDESVLVRCGSLEYISSAGLRVLLVAHKRGGSRLALCELTDMVREVLEVSGFNTLFQIADTKEQALEMLAS